MIVVLIADFSFIRHSRKSQSRAAKGEGQILFLRGGVSFLDGGKQNLPQAMEPREFPFWGSFVRCLD